MIRGAAAVALLLIAGCTCAPPTPTCTAFTMPLTTFLVTGRPNTMDVSLWESCGGINVVVSPDHLRATQVVVEVTDPDGNPAPFTVSQVRREGAGASFRNTANVTFTPDRVGAWLLKARFEPDLGTVQQFIPAMDARTSVVAHTVPSAPFPATCEQFGVTRVGTVLCGNRPELNNPTEVITHHGQKLVGPAFAVEGDALWGWNGSATVTRYVEDAGLFVPTHTATASMGTVVRLGAAAGDLYALTSSTQIGFETRLYRFHPEDDGGVVRTERRFPVGFVANAIAPRDDRVMFIAAVDFKTTRVVVLDGGDATLTPLLAPAMGATVPVGADADAIWQIGLGALRVTDDTTPMVNGPDVAIDRATVFGPVLWPHAPTVFTNLASTPVAFPRNDGGTLWFEVFTGDHRPPLAATGRHVFAKSNDGQSLLVIDR